MSTTPRELVQSAPWPDALERLVDGLSYKEGWGFSLTPHMDRGQGSEGLTFTVYTNTRDSYHPENFMRVAHLFIVPAAAYDERSWRRWLFDRLVDVETHEAMEFFQIDGDRPFAPSHGPGNDPYLIREVGTELDRRTSFRGEVKQ